MQGVRLDAAADWSRFEIVGGQHYNAFERAIPADFSTATFFLAAGALPGNKVTCEGLDVNDCQGDRAVLDYLRAFGADVAVDGDRVTVTARDLKGCELDLNDTPDALPMMAALAAFASGETRLINVGQARNKETDRIAVMRQELAKFGADVEELPDGLVVREAALRPAAVEGHGDHRVIMSLGIAATQLVGESTVAGADAMAVTFPEFAEALIRIGGDIDPEAAATQKVSE
jgi:3-phosphoshikimate 1-carboxyvinyltransferase